MFTPLSALFQPLATLGVTSGRYVFVNFQSIVLRIRDFNIIANNTRIVAKSTEKQMKKCHSAEISRFYRQEK